MKRSIFPFTSLLGSIAIAAVLCSPLTTLAAEADLAKQLQQHADRVAINDTLVQYTRGLDTVDADVYAGAFTADARFLQGDSPETAKLTAEGTAQIRKIITDLATTDAASKAKREAEWKGEGQAPARLRHHVMTNAVVELVDANTAHHRAYWMTVGGSGRDMTVLAMGSYQDTLVKQNGRWLIKERFLLAR